MQNRVSRFAVTILAMTLVPSVAWAIFPQLSARLVGVPTNGMTPRGDAKVNQQNYPAVPPRLEIKAENINLPNGTVLTVHMHGAQIGTLTVNNRRIQGQMNTLFQVGANEDLFIRNAGVNVLYVTDRWNN